MKEIKTNSGTHKTRGKLWFNFDSKLHLQRLGLAFGRWRLAHFSAMSAREGGKAVSPTHRSHLSPWYSFMLLNILRPEGLSEWKILMTPTGTEPTTFRLRHRVLWFKNRILPVSLFQLYLVETSRNLYRNKYISGSKNWRELIQMQIDRIIRWIVIRMRCTTQQTICSSQDATP
jgi:hypothetical protein